MITRANDTVADVVSAETVHVPLPALINLAASTVRQCTPKLFQLLYNRMKNRVKKECGLTLKR